MAQGVPEYEDINLSEASSLSTHLLTAAEWDVRWEPDAVNETFKQQVQFVAFLTDFLFSLCVGNNSGL